MNADDSDSSAFSSVLIRVHLWFQMKVLDQPLVLSNANAGPFRRWLKSDMHIMRWVFLVLYVLILASLLVASLTDPNDSGPFFALIIAMLAMFVAQAVLIFGAGTVQLCRPVHRRRLLIPVIVASLMLALLVLGFCLAMMELLRLDHLNWPDWAAVAFWIFIGASWIGWGALLFAHVKYLPRYSIISRLATYLFAGSLAELLAAVPSHVIVSRRPGVWS